MSRTVRKIQKKLSKPKNDSPPSIVPPSDFKQALDEFITTESNAVKKLFDSIGHILAEQKSLGQTLQETRRKYQETLDDLSFAREEIKELQAAKTKLEQDKLKAEQNFRWAKVELQVAKDELKRVEEKISLEAELDQLEGEIAHYERRIKRSPGSRETCESQLQLAQEARARCLERLKELEEARSPENFNADSSFRFLSGESNAALWEYVDSFEPTDEIIFRAVEDETRLLEAWGADDVAFVSAKTVPLKDFVLTTAESAARMIFDGDNSTGVLIVESKMAGLPKMVKLAFFVQLTDESLVLSAEAGYDSTLAAGKIFLESRADSRANFLALSKKFLSLWCAVERALLNPPIYEYVMGQRMAGAGQGGGQGTASVTYVKRVPITVDDLLPADVQKNFERHADKWGVCGHWRKCAGGKTVWVRPHEKGRKRGQKTDNPNLRERILPNV